MPVKTLALVITFVIAAAAATVWLAVKFFADGQITQASIASISILALILFVIIRFLSMSGDSDG